MAKRYCRAGASCACDFRRILRTSSPIAGPQATNHRAPLFLVAPGLAALLAEAGTTVVGPIGWAEEALAFVEDEADTLDGAVLDVNLHGEKSYSIADALTRRHVRFVFVTG
ncbi:MULTISPECIES: hypothetical protein [Paraburkholderia]|uniref:hypothetical protein n=1 Tax=Paraburkholderia TaxID=1822464 RepID=UPI001FE5E5DA|nr:hypothetical protein [Paraburkholderia podalyriae]